MYTSSKGYLITLSNNSARTSNVW